MSRFFMVHCVWCSFSQSVHWGLHRHFH